MNREFSSGTMRRLLKDFPELTREIANEILNAHEYHEYHELSKDAFFSKYGHEIKTSHARFFILNERYEKYGIKDNHNESKIFVHPDKEGVVFWEFDN